jgi:hypothetical protein
MRIALNRIQKKYVRSLIEIMKPGNDDLSEFFAKKEPDDLHPALAR